MKYVKKNLWALIAVGLLCFIGIGGFIVFAQEETSDEAEDCKWHIQDQITGTSYRVNTFLWNDCTGEVFHLENLIADYDISDVSIKKIR